MLAVPMPRFLQIEPVGQCNLRCRMCPIQFRRDGPPFGPPAFMELDTFRHLLDEFDELDELHLQGLGEPFMHPQFFEMVSYASERGIRVSTNSNLTLLTAQRAERCIDSGLDWLHVSIDGPSAAVYERIRIRSRFARVMQNLQNLLDARRRRGSERPHLRMVTVVMRENLEDLPDLVRLAARYEFEAMFVQHLCHDFTEETLPSEYLPMRDFIEEQSLLGEELERVERHFDEARSVARDLGVDLRLPRPRPRAHAANTPGRARCGWPWDGAYVSYRGEAMPCCMIATPDRLNFGNVAEEGFLPVWNSAQFDDFRARLDSDSPPDICRSCSVYRGTF